MQTPAASPLEATGAGDLIIIIIILTRWSSEEETSCAII